LWWPFHGYANEEKYKCCLIYLKVMNERVKRLDFPVRPARYPILPAFCLKCANSNLESPWCFFDWKMEVLSYVD
jgi:hypothetical protein